MACFFCEKSAVDSCQTCGADYCSKGHLEVHKNRSGDCQPFQLQRREGVGRILVATRDVKPFEVVLEDVGVAWGPFDDSESLCVVCLSEVSADNPLLCQDCNLPICSLTCGSSRTHDPECLVLRNHSPDKLVVSGRHPVYSLIAPLRIYHSKTHATSPNSCDDRLQRVMDLESHLEDRKRDLDWRLIQDKALPILKACGIPNEDINLIEQIIGIIKTNSVSLLPKPGSESRGYGVFPLFSMLSHNCMANCRYSVGQTNQTVVVRAMRPITKGQELTIQYKSPLLGTHARRQRLKDQWKFRVPMPKMDPN